MDNIGNVVTNTVQQGSKPFEPTYVNLEYIFQKILDFFRGASWSGGTGGGEVSSAFSLWAILKILLLIFAILFLAIIIYCIIRIFEIRKKEEEFTKNEISEYAHKQKEAEERISASESTVNRKWQNVLDHAFSSNEANWKLSIVEADIMLDELMTQLGFKGDSLGEKLKSADQESFKHLSDAWEVHTIRNKIAHEGVEFPLSQHEVKRVVAIYEKIFRDYDFV